MLENVLILTRHNCNSYFCSTRPVPSHDTYLRDRGRAAMIRACNAFWAGDYYPVVYHRCDLMDPYCGAPGRHRGILFFNPYRPIILGPAWAHNYDHVYLPRDRCWLDRSSNATAERALVAQPSRAAYSPPYSPGPPTTLHAVQVLSWLVRSLRSSARNCQDF